MSYLYVTAIVLAVYCLAAGSTLPPRWQMSANGVGSGKDYFVVRSVYTIFGSAQERRHLGNKNKKGFLFCSPLGLHYLCPHILIR